MRVRLKKKWREYPVGSVMNVTRPVALELISKKQAEEYTGEYPPKDKMETNFFNPLK